jgi:CYTH domain-containing protein
MKVESNLEIERKYVISKPSVDSMRACESYGASEIVQIYLESEVGITHRIRSRAFTGGRTLYYETRKIRVDRMSSHEYEREIDREEFDTLSLKIADGSRPIVKTRHTFDYLGQTFEIDVYPDWERTCIMETELPSRDTEVTFPDFIRVVAEVTGDKRYSNAAMSRKFPEEL